MDPEVKDRITFCVAGIGLGMIIVIVAIAFIMGCAATVHGQVRRPPIDDSIWCQILPDTCDNGEFTRVVPEGPSSDPNVSYLLPRAVGVTQVNYELEPVGKRVTAHFTTHELLQDLATHDIPAAKIWMENDPFDGMGSWCWHTYWGSEVCTDQCNHDCDPDAPCVIDPVVEMMREVWTHPAVSVIALRPTSQMWTSYEYGCKDDPGPVIAAAPYYDITTLLYDNFWWLDKTIILTDWEQDWVIRGRGCRGWDFPFRDAPSWYSEECQSQCLEVDGSTAEGCRRSCGLELLADRAKHLAILLEQRQAGVEQARREARLKYGRLRLNVLHSVIINKYPDNEEEDEAPTVRVADLVPSLEHQPDLLGLSYYVRGKSVTETLDWIREKTRYPRYRIYIDEIGERADLASRDQYARIYDTVSDFWEWGGRLAFVWMWKQTWCGSNYGLFEQVQPCDGKVEWGEPTGGYRAIMELNERRD